MLKTKQELNFNWSSFFIVTAAPLLIFTSARNTIIWHCQQLWAASGNFWQLQWNRVLYIVGEDSLTLWFYGTFLVPFFVYWTFGILYTLLDLTNKPLGLMKYKMQPGVNEPVDPKKVLKVMLNVFINLTFFTIPISYLNYIVMEWRGYPNIRELPTFHSLLIQLTILIISEEIGFYYTHRILHCSFLYKYVHKKHHEWTAPIALTALYAHPVEFLFSNLLPMCLGVYILGSHIFTTYVWFSIGMLATLHSHCGYHFPFIPSPEFHDFHHQKFNQCFGVLGLMDRIHGTDTKFRKTINNSRHIMTLNLKPLREMFPDPVPRNQTKKS